MLIILWQLLVCNHFCRPKSAMGIDQSLRTIYLTALATWLNWNLRAILIHRSAVLRPVPGLLLTKMPHLDHSVRLDFKDVLIRPKRSTIRSRADVSTSSVARCTCTKQINSNYNVHVQQIRLFCLAAQINLTAPQLGGDRLLCNL